MEKVKFTRARGLLAIRNHGVRTETVNRWEAEGEMPAKYADLENGYKIGDKTLFSLRVAKYPTQSDFLAEFNRRFKLNVTQVHLSNWERGKNAPSKVYQRYLNEFFI